jgi:hypothetical protein
MVAKSNNTKAPARGHDPNNKTHKSLERERNKAAGLKRCEVWVRKEDVPALKEFEHRSREKAIKEKQC